LERLTRLVKAYEWRLIVDKLEKSGASLEQKHKDLEAAKEDIERGGEECKGMEKELQEIEERRAKVSHPTLCHLTLRKWPRVARCRRSPTP
jgi:structural maintenance of chromosome 2